MACWSCNHGQRSCILGRMGDSFALTWAGESCIEPLSQHGERRRMAASGGAVVLHGRRGCGATCARGRICFFRSLVAINCRRNKGVRETTESSCNPVRREQLIERMQGDRLNLAPVHGRLASTYAESTQLFHVRLRDSSRRENRLGVGPTILMQKKKKNMRCMARLSGRQSRARLHRTEEIKDITCDTGAERTIHLLGWR